MRGVRLSALAALFVSIAVVGSAEPQATAAGQRVSVPHVVRFDGVFVPADGQPAAEVETATLAVYAGPAGGAPLWEETQFVRVGAQGRYAVLLGATRPDGLSPDVLTGGNARWLEVRFARADASPQPRVLLTSVPYALRTSDADTLGGLPASAFLRAAEPGAEGAPTGRGGDADSAASADRSTGPAVSTGTPGYLGKFTNAVDLTSSVMFETSGRVGVNTTSPLDIVHARFTDNSGGITGLAVQNLGSSTAAYSGMLFYDQNGALGQFQGFNNATHEYRINNVASGGTINFMLGSTSRFLVRNDGDIDVSGNLRKGGNL